MGFYSQRDPRWAWRYIPGSKCRFWGYGCLICSIANLLSTYDGPQARNPLIIATILNDTGAIDTEGRVTCLTAAKSLGVAYKKSNKKPKTICIAETDAFRPKVPQHFFLLNPLNSLIIDPLDLFPKWKKKPTKYRIVSFREFYYV